MVNQNQKSEGEVAKVLGRERKHIFIIAQFQKRKIPLGEAGFRDTQAEDFLSLANLVEKKLRVYFTQWLGHRLD